MTEEGPEAQTQKVRCGDHDAKPVWFCRGDSWSTKLYWLSRLAVARPRRPGLTRLTELEENSLKSWYGCAPALSKLELEREKLGRLRLGEGSLME